MVRDKTLGATFLHSLKELEEFVSENFSHISAEEFFRERNIAIEEYRSIHLSRPYVGLVSDTERLYQTELRLAEEAITKACKYVTNIDYGANYLVARGWKLK